MCKTKMATDAAQPAISPRTPSRRPSTPSRHSRKSGSDSARPAAAVTKTLPSTSSSSYPSASTSIHYSTSSYNNKDSKNSKASHSSLNSLSSLLDTLPETPIVYDISEIRAATNNFLAKRTTASSSTTPSWLCTLRNKEVIIFQRKSRKFLSPSNLRKKLSAICRSHYLSIIKLLGASISTEQIYLVYEFVPGSSLSSCLRNPRNPNFTVLSTWMSRMQIATDLAHGLDYIHSNMNFVHNHIKSSSVIVTEPDFHAKICHFGAAQLCGEVDWVDDGDDADENEIERLSGLTKPQFQGTVGYMSPEFQTSGIGTQKSDVYAFGVVLLELLSGEEPCKYRVDNESGEIRRTSVIETAEMAVKGGGDDGGGGFGRLRRWVDRRLRDSFPVEVAEKLTRVALECVHAEEDKRPDMRRAAGKISKLYLDSVKWASSLQTPSDMISVSLAPR